MNNDTAATYTTLTDLIEREIAPALDGADCTAEQVAEELRERGLIEWAPEAQGLQLLATEDEFWAVVAELDKAANN